MFRFQKPCPRKTKFLMTAVCLGFLLGCSPPPANEQKVEANTPLNFTLWRSKNSQVLTGKEWSLFDLATEELKIQIMRSGQASGSEAVDLALRTQIDGMKLGDVMQSGLQLRLKRLLADQALLEDAFAINSKLKLKRGDEEKAAMLAAKVQEQSERLTKLKATVAEAEADLHQLELKFK